jgi:transposase-like protein
VIKLERNVAIFSGGTVGTILKLACPHCGEPQVRSRKPAGEKYACRRCHRRFSREQGLATAARIRNR